MAVSPNKGYELMVTGSEANNWGNIQNAQQFTYIDNNVGGIATKSLSSSNIVLSATEAQMAILRLTGTLSANVQVTSACIGFVFVENLTTGSFTVTYTNGVAGVVIPKGRSTVIADATNGARIVSSNDIVSGTVMLFVQTLAPTGWTKSTAHDNKALRIVSGTASSGGTTSFTSCFSASRMIARANLPNDTVNVDLVDPGHVHHGDNFSGSNGVSSGGSFSGSFNPGDTDPNTTGITGSIKLNGGVSQTAFDLAVQYLDVVAAVRD